MHLQSKLVGYRRTLHQHPELSMQEKDTTERIKVWLAENNIPILDLSLPVGVVAQIKGGQAGPTIALRADIDALPIKEQTGVEYSSQSPGVMHACGHDVHIAAMLGAAILLNERKDMLAGTVRILFQPAEETAGGAKWLAAQLGVMDDVEAVLGFHNKPDLPVGTVGIRPGPLMASVDRFEIEITGTGGHGGMPERCIDPIVVGSQLVNAVQTVVSRRISSLDNAVISVTKFISGNTWNVIPESAHMEGTVRTFQEGAREKIPQLLQEICEGIGRANGASVKFIWHPGVGCVKNTPAFTKLAWQVAEREGLFPVEAECNLAGEDFSHYLEQVPGCFLWLGVDGPYQWHHPSYSINEDALHVGASYFAELAQEVLDQWKSLRQ